ncbi:MAG: hypothetical protein C4542_03010 [Dehalococcoidia bacterium]|nr:MAG: hypothetical protein C4542_03010 [Dehalococcoidia bacterium]
MDGWQKLKRVCGYAGVALEYIPVDDQPYEVYVIFPDSRQMIAKSRHEEDALEQAIHWFDPFVKQKEAPAASTAEASGGVG